MPEIMCEADYLDKLTAICVKCGNPASCTQRITKQKDQVIIGRDSIRSGSWREGIRMGRQFGLWFLQS